MTNKLRTLFAFSALATSFAALPAFGGEFEPLHVTVPFSFTAGKATLPAGEYTVYESDSHVLMIRGEKGSALLLTYAGNAPEDAKSALGFEHTDKGYLLRSVHSSGRPTSLLPARTGEK
jgi:hypothetical protein